MIEQQFNNLERVVASNGLVECAQAPTCDLVGIRSVLEQKLYYVVIVPVRLPQKHDRQAVRCQFATSDKNGQRAIIISLRTMVCNFAIVGVSAALEQKPRQLRVMCNSGGAIKDAFEFRLWLMFLLKKSGIRARPRIQQRRCRSNKSRRAIGIQSEIAGKAKVRECVPIVRASFHRRVLWIER